MSFWPADQERLLQSDTKNPAPRSPWAALSRSLLHGSEGAAVLAPHPRGGRNPTGLVASAPVPRGWTRAVELSWGCGMFESWCVEGPRLRLAEPGAGAGRPRCQVPRSKPATPPVSLLSQGQCGFPSTGTMLGWALWRQRTPARSSRALTTGCSGPPAQLPGASGAGARAGSALGGLVRGRRGFAEPRP